MSYPVQLERGEWNNQAPNEQEIEEAFRTRGIGFNKLPSELTKKFQRCAGALIYCRSVPIVFFRSGLTKEAWLATARELLDAFDNYSPDDVTLRRIKKAGAFIVASVHIRSGPIHPLESFTTLQVHQTELT